MHGYAGCCIDLGIFLLTGQLGQPVSSGVEIGTVKLKELPLPCFGVLQLDGAAHALDYHFGNV